MSALSVFRKALRDMRWQVLGYGFGLALFAAIVVFIYPSYAGQLADFELPETLRNLFGEGDLGTGPGFVSSEFFSQTVPVLVLIFAIMQGTSALAGEEANGTIDLLLSQPLTRRSVVLEKVTAFVVGTVMIAALTCLGWFVSVPFVEIDLPLGRTVVATFTIVPLTLAFGALALWSGAAFPSRRAATAFVTVLAVATYILNAFALLVDALEPLKWLSPFQYYNGTTVIADGPDLPRMGVLLAMFVVFTALSVVAFERRDLGVRGAGMPWRRPRRSAATT